MIFRKTISVKCLDEPNTGIDFPKNDFRDSQTAENIFLFRKLAFPENMYFLEIVLRQPNAAGSIFLIFTGALLLLILVFRQDNSVGPKRFFLCNIKSHVDAESSVHDPFSLFVHLLIYLFTLLIYLLLLSLTRPQIILT